MDYSSSFHTQGYIEQLVCRYPALESSVQDILAAYKILLASYEKGGKLLVTGNGGSAADADHIVGTLMKSFTQPRPIGHDYFNALTSVDSDMGTILAQNLQVALPAIALDGHSALSTAYANDCNPVLCFAQQVNGYGMEGDVFLGISTSGNSMNVLYAAVVAKAKGMHVVGLTGAKESKLMKYSDVCIRVPETETFKIQELHIPVYHVLCRMLESYFFGSNH